MIFNLTSADFESGTIDAAGSHNDNPARIRTINYFTTDSYIDNYSVSVKTHSNKKILIGFFGYDNSTSLLIRLLWYENNYIFKPNIKLSKFRLVILYETYENIDPSDIESVTVNIFSSWVWVNGEPCIRTNPKKQTPDDLAFSNALWAWKKDRVSDTIKNGFMPEGQNIKFPTQQKAKWVWNVNPYANNGNPYNGFMPMSSIVDQVVTYDYIDLLDSVPVYSAPHGLDSNFPCIKMEIPLNAPEETKYTLGNDQTVSLTSSNASENATIKKEIEKLPRKSVILADAQRNATQMIRSGTNGYVTLKRHENPDGTLGNVEELIISDEPDYTIAKNVWRWNKNGLGFSNDGYDGRYETAITADGSIVADRITAGILSGDRIRGGELALGHWGYENPDGTIDYYDGVLKVYKSDGNLSAKFDSSGAQIWGEVWSYDNDVPNFEDSKRTTALADGQVSFYLNGNKIGHIAGWSVYESDRVGTMSVSAMDKDGKIADGIVFQARWIGVEGPNDNGVTSIDMSKRELNVITDISYDSEGKINRVDKKTIVFRGPFMTAIY